MGPILRSTVPRAMLALGLWAVVHSTLASLRLKRLAEAVLGERRMQGTYRLGYNVLALLSFGAVLRYVWRLPDRRLYAVRGLPRALMLGGQVVTGGLIAQAAFQVGIPAFLGLPSLWTLLRNRPIAPSPAAQHPLPEPGVSELRWNGPYRLSRHPLNYFVLALFWLTPVMTVKWAALGALTAVYMVLGSIHEGTRLRARYGELYLRYREEAPHVLLPLGRWLRRIRATSEVGNRSA